MKKLVVYLATPYSYVSKSKEIGLTKPDFTQIDKEIRKKRFKIVNQAAGKLIERGFAVISPISQSHPIAIECNMEGKFGYWEQIDYAFILRSDLVFVLCVDGWRESEGVTKEIMFAKQNNIPIMYIDQELRIQNG